MADSNAVAIAAAWQDAANNQDIDHLLTLSDSHIEIIGPRGSAVGHDILRDWLVRAGASFTTLGSFSRGDTIVFAQHGVWRTLETDEIVGEADVASVFRVGGGRVVQYARYATLAEALAKADLIAAETERETA